LLYPARPLIPPPMSLAAMIKKSTVVARRLLRWEKVRVR
jgi:hypothetical protein